MARLRGLPSEHHHEGPGDAPRHKRGRASQKAPSPKSNPIAKRSASLEAEVPQSKRAKRTELDHDTDDNIDVERLANSNPMPRHNHRRHSEPPVTASEEQQQDSSDLPPSTQLVPGLTPHLDRIGAARTRFTNKRRARMSMPAQLRLDPVDEIEENGSQIQYAPLTAVLDSRTRRRLRRSHLSQELNELEDHQKKDKKVLLELRRQLRVQDEKIQDLEFRLEARRLGDIDITDEHAEELEQQLVQARQEIDELRASSLYNGDETFTNVSGEEDDGLLLVNPEELSFSQDLDVVHTPDSKYASRVLELAKEVTFESLPEISQLNHDTLTEHDAVVPDGHQDQVVERYERELQHYISLLAESQGAMRVVTIELQNLHFCDPGATTSEIITEMRRGYDALRANIEKYFPGTTKDLTNRQLLAHIPQLLSGIFFELKEKLFLLSASQKTELLLRRQYEGVLDLFGESDERVEKLQKELYTIDKSNEGKQRTILDLDERMAALENVANNQLAELKAKDALIQELREENDNNEASIGRLRDAIEVYRRDLDTVTNTATALEQQHVKMIADIEQEHAEAIERLQNEVDVEVGSREAAEAEVLRQVEYIEQLENRIANMDTDVDTITTEMQTLRDRLTAQNEARGLAEGERDEANRLADEHASDIKDLNQQIRDLKEHLEELKSNLAAEQTQREKTEADLDRADENIAELNDNVRHAGIQANELRSKLFELQQEKEAALAQLEEEAKNREDDLTSQLTTEVDVRFVAEATIGQLQEQIASLQDSLAKAEASLDKMQQARNQLEQDRDTQVTNLAAQLMDLKAKYAALENSTNSTITSLQANIIDLNNQVQRQQAEIKHLVEEAAEKERLHVEQTAALQEKMDSMEDELVAQKAENEQYRKENASLSTRVENEAQELLNIVGSHVEEVSALKNTIGTHEATILNLQTSSSQRKMELENELQNRDQQISELDQYVDARDETIYSLENQIMSLTKRFEEHEQDSRSVIEHLLASQRDVLDRNADVVDAFKKRNADALAKVLDTKTRGKQNRAELGKVRGGAKVVKTTEKVSKTGEKVRMSRSSSGKKKGSRRQWDSGVGLDERVEEGSDVEGELDGGIGVDGDAEDGEMILVA